MSRVSLKLITSENWREALELSVDAQQQKFVAAVSPPVAIALAKAYIRPNGMMVEPYGIYDQHNMVGFLNLHYSPDSKDDFWIDVIIMQSAKFAAYVTFGQQCATAVPSHKTIGTLEMMSHRRMVSTA